MNAAAPVFVVLFGPPAVGKMTVGRALGARTGFPLFTNHMTIEPLLPIFEFGSPPFTRLVRIFRNSIFEEVASSAHRGLIFTYVWAFDYDDDLAFIDSIRALFTSRGWRAVFVELHAALPVRLERNATPDRIAAKPSKQDVDASTARLLDLDARYRLTSGGTFPWPDEYLHIDNSALAPDDVADRIISHFGLPATGPG